MQEMEYFYLLKHRLLEKYREFYPHWDKPLHEFKGREIANFQLQLQKEINGRISEKWFYTHLKPKENEKLPRIDILDMLSQFVGYKNWEDFISNQTTTIPKKTTSTSLGAKTIFRRYGHFLILGLFAYATFFAWSKWNKKQAYHFCFINADTQTPIQETQVTVQVLRSLESPIYYQANDQACFELSTQEKQVHFIVRADYYHTDTIHRILNDEILEEKIPLRRDDYALMIHLFSKGKTQDWKRLRLQLAKIIAADAVIFQVAADGTTGMEMYNRTEFIDKMSLPLSSLKNIDIIHTDYHNGQITSLRFMQKEQIQ